MKEYMKTNRILFILIGLAVLVSVAVVGNRWRAESGNKTYDVVLDYNELELLAEQSEEDITWWLEQFRDMGITRVGLTEESLSTLMENSPFPVSATLMDEVMQDAAWMEQYPAAFVDEITRYGYDRFDVLVEAGSTEAVDFVTDAVSKRFHREDVVMLDQGDACYILINGTVTDTLYTETQKLYTTKSDGFIERRNIASSKLLYLSLGLMPEKVEAIQSLGMEVIPRTLCYNGRNDTHYAQAVVEGYRQYNIDPAYVIAGGEAVIGYDDAADDFALDYIRDNQITIGLIETNVQRENILQTGVEEIAEAAGYNTVRVFSVWNYIQYRYGYYGYTGAEEIENTFYRAIVERNIRILYFKPIKYTDDSFAYVTDPDVYRDLFESLDQRLSVHGISRGRASVLADIQVPSLALLAMGLGAGLCGAALPASFLPVGKKWTLLLAGTAAALVGAAWVVLPNSFRLLCQRGGVCVSGGGILPVVRQAYRPDSACGRGSGKNTAAGRRDSGGRGAHRPGRSHDDGGSPLLHPLYAGDRYFPGRQAGAACAAGLLLRAVCGLLRHLRKGPEAGYPPLQRHHYRPAVEYPRVGAAGVGRSGRGGILLSGPDRPRERRVCVHGGDRVPQRPGKPPPGPASDKGIFSGLPRHYAGGLLRRTPYALFHRSLRSGRDHRHDQRVQHLHAHPHPPVPGLCADRILPGSGRGSGRGLYCMLGTALQAVGPGGEKIAVG